MKDLAITKIVGREILDSRGNPTVEAEVYLANGNWGRSAVPSGASTGEYEAIELRDQDVSRYDGKGVLKAVDAITSKIGPALMGLDASKMALIDQTMISLDQTPDKSYLGANSLLAVSMAAMKAAANAHQIPLYQWVGGMQGNTLPVPMMNILNGGAHANNTVDVQEFMIMPVGAKSFKEGLCWSVKVFQTLKNILKEKKLAVSVGDEGGFAPDLSGDEEAIQLLVEAILQAGFTPGKDFAIGIDAAASEWKTKEEGVYYLPKAKKEITTEELVMHWQQLCQRYPIYSIEDGLGENDYQGWEMMTRLFKGKIQLVGDDLFVTNPKRLQMGIERGLGNAILIKPNQIGTMWETIKAVQMAKRAGYGVILSHRSGETEDTTIADLAVGLNAGQIKTGAPSRSERVAKYNQLLRIEEELQEEKEYLGKKALPIKISE